jgi:organic hydroperoxide reductase OsmC/OhrA
VRTLLLVEKAEKACLVSRSLNSKITLSPKVVVETAVPAL